MRHFRKSAASSGKDHTTIIHACRQISKAKESDSALHTTLEGLKEQI